MKIQRLCILISVALTLLHAGHALADGLVRDGIGPISSGRGGTNIAFSDNGAVLNDNPAGMMNMQSNGLCEMAIDTVVCDLHYTDTDNNSRSAVRPLPSPELAYFRKSDDGCWAYGIGAYAVAGFGASWRMDNPQFGPNQHYKSIGAYGRLLPGLAYQVNERLSIGAAIGLGVCYAELEGPFYLSSGAPASIDLQGTGVAPTGTLGLQYKWDDSTTVGLSYTEETRFNIDDGRMNATVLTPFGPLQSRFDTAFKVVWPRMAGIGIKHNLCDCQRVSADVIWYDWAHAFDTFSMQLTNSTNPAFAGATINEALPLSWHDSVSLRLGYEWSPTDTDVVRCGYCYHHSPVPNSTLNPYFDGVLEHAFSVGWSKRFDRCVLNLAYQYAFSPTREVTTSILNGGDFANSTFKAEAHWASIGFSVPF